MESRSVGVLCPACGAWLEPGAKCDQCDGPVQQRDRDRARRRIYDSARWRRVSDFVIARDGRCVDCGRTIEQLGENEVLVADHVHGVLEVDDPFDPAGCEARCSTCSGRKDRARR